MPRIGQVARRLVAGWALAGAAVALLTAAWMWGFTVDDALIAVRYARHIVGGAGWRFDAHGPSTDGVTPLAWPLLLAPLARAESLVVLARAKALGLAAWTVGGGVLGGAIGRQKAAPSWARAAALGVLGLSVPVAAHAVSGMETALATTLATAAATCVSRPRLAAVLAGLAASLRPEMAPWACVLAAGFVVASPGRSPARVGAAAIVAIVPFAACALVRVVAWGRPAPLALMAKPSDVAHGLVYAAAGCVVTLTPVLALAPLSLRRAPHALAIVAAAIVHVGAVVAVGGDWMPYARLLAPVAPSLAFAGVLASVHARPWATASRSAIAALLGVLLVATGGTSGREVGRDRETLIAAARPLLAGATRVAALDIGWLSAATEADIIDLAGLTDPEIAALPGGHTSKRVGAMFLLMRDPDFLLLYAPEGLPAGDLDAWQAAPYRGVVEARLASDDAIARHFTPAAWLPLGTSGGYVVLKKR